MDSRNLLVFTVYILVVSYVIYKALQSLKDLVKIQPDNASINEQLAEQGLQDIVEVGFKFKDSYRLEDFMNVKISIKNKTKDEIIYVDWNQCYIIDFDQVADRAIRLISGMTEPPQKQVGTSIRPGQSIQEAVRNEDLIGPMFKPKVLKKAALEEKQFVIRLPLSSTNIDGISRSGLLRCFFTARLLSWTEALAISMKPPKQED